jgi:hypothetical protein
MVTRRSSITRPMRHLTSYDTEPTVTAAAGQPDAGNHATNVEPASWS